MKFVKQQGRAKAARKCCGVTWSRNTSPM